MEAPGQVSGAVTPMPKNESDEEPEWPLENAYCDLNGERENHG